MILVVPPILSQHFALFIAVTDGYQVYHGIANERPDDPIIPMTNNDAGRSIRKFCIGRNSWHVISTKDGARSSAILYSLAETASANGLKPYYYFKYLLEQLMEHFDEPFDDYLDDLMPWSEKLLDE